MNYKNCCGKIFHEKYAEYLPEQFFIAEKLLEYKSALTRKADNT